MASGKVFFSLNHTFSKKTYFTSIIKRKRGGTRGVMVIVVGNGHVDTSSNPGRD